MLRRPPALSASALSTPAFSWVGLHRPAELPNCRPADLPTCRPADLDCRPALMLVPVTSTRRIVFPQQSKDRLAWWQGWWSRPSPRRSRTRKR